MTAKRRGVNDGMKQVTSRNSMPAAGSEIRHRAGSKTGQGKGADWRLFGLRFQDLPLAEVAASIVAAALNNQSRKIFFVNAHCVNVAYGNPEYFKLLREQPLLYADGLGMRLAAKIAGTPLRYNVNGTDLFPHICGEAAERGVPIALLGAAPGVVDACAENMRQMFPKLQIAWTHHGYMTDEEEAEVLRTLPMSGAKILFVAKGVPKQELWINEHANNVGMPITIGVGALFDFFSNSIPRAPKWVRKIHMEWLFRLIMEPRRLFVRYVVGNPIFLGRALISAARGTLRDPERRDKK